MKVKQLIERLSKFDPDLEVYIPDQYDGYELAPVEIEGAIVNKKKYCIERYCQPLDVPNAVIIN